MRLVKPAVHFVDKYLLSPGNPVIVNLIGAGGTGSQVLTCLSRINHSLNALDHPGLVVRLFDDDLVTRANLGRQLFADAELGQPKASALISRVNRFFGTNWKSVCSKFSADKMDENHRRSNVTITCVDSVKTRFEIAAILEKLDTKTLSEDRLLYWMDFGNGLHHGQVVLSTIADVKQPASKKFSPVAKLPFITDEFKTSLESSEDTNLPSCSLSEALLKQDLFINTSLCALGSSLLWSMFREGMLNYRGFFLNLKDFRTQPLSIQIPVANK